MEFKWTTWKVFASVLALSGSAATIAAVAHASSGANVTTIKAALTDRLPKTEITEIDCDKIEGVCEVQARQNLFYIDHSARYLIIGRVYDMETKQDLTAARLLEMNPDMLIGGGARPSRTSRRSASNKCAQPSRGAVRLMLASIPQPFPRFQRAAPSGWGRAAVLSPSSAIFVAATASASTRRCAPSM